MRLARITALAVGLLGALGALGACQSSDVSRSVGAECGASSECDDRCLQGDDYPDGFCTLTCDSDDNCPVNAECIEDQGGVCLITCALDTGCAFLGSGWSCQQETQHGGSGSGGMVLVCRGG